VVVLLGWITNPTSLIFGFVSFRPASFPPPQGAPSANSLTGRRPVLAVRLGCPAAAPLRLLADFRRPPLEHSSSPRIVTILAGWSYARSTPRPEPERVLAVASVLIGAITCRPRSCSASTPLAVPDRDQLRANRHLPTPLARGADPVASPFAVSAFDRKCPGRPRDLLRIGLLRGADPSLV